MTAAYYLRGYDRTTEFMAAEFRLPARLLGFIRALVRPPADDPDMIFAYELADSSVARISRAMGTEIDPTAFGYYVEANAAPDSDTMPDRTASQAG